MNDNVIVQEALHSLYRELQLKQQEVGTSSAKNSFEIQPQLSPDDFE